VSRPEDRASRRLYEEFGFSASPQLIWRRDVGAGCEQDA
jgi:hypothetical protein